MRRNGDLRMPLSFTWYPSKDSFSFFRFCSVRSSRLSPSAASADDLFRFDCRSVCSEAVVRLAVVLLAATCVSFGRRESGMSKGRSASSSLTEDRDDEEDDLRRVCVTSRSIPLNVGILGDASSVDGNISAETFALTGDFASGETDSAGFEGTIGRLMRSVGPLEVVSEVKGSEV